jgi:hypothetical protein
MMTFSAFAAFAAGASAGEAGGAKADAKADASVSASAASTSDATKADPGKGPFDGNPWTEKGGLYDREAPSSDEVKPFTVAPLLGYATNELNLGVGVRAGYTIPQHVYFGATFVYHFGTSSELSVGGQKASASLRVFYPAGEVGYDLHLGNALIRPYAGGGALFVRASASGGGESTSDTESRLVVYPGLLASYEIPHTDAFVGADARLLVLTSGGDPTFGAFFTAGGRF